MYHLSGAVGMGYGQDDIHKSFSLTLGIGLQDIPEGLAVGFILMMYLDVTLV